jgi:hypothetical protein
LFAQLCAEFRCPDLCVRISSVPNGQSRISALEERVSLQDRRIAALEAFLPCFQRPSAVADAMARLPPLITDHITSAISAELLKVHSDITVLKNSSFSLVGHLNSLIVDRFPDLFEDFRSQRFRLLWRGSRDGFGASEFHQRCDGHTNTLTIVQDTNDFVFGGFTPLAWESRGHWKPDTELKSFLFTLKNPHHSPPQRFPLRRDRFHRAILGYRSWGPMFGSGPADLGVCDDCQANAGSYSGRFGNTYANESGIDGKRLFTNAPFFTVKEIEVFEVVD